MPLPNKKPLYRVKPNPNSPYSKGLWLFFLPRYQFGPIEDIANNYLTPTDSDITFEIDPDEQCVISMSAKTGNAFNNNFVWFTDTYSVTARVYLTDLSFRRYILSGDQSTAGNGGQCFRFNSLNVLFHSADGDAQTMPSSDMALNTWQTHTIRRNGTYAEYWIDNNFQGSVNTFTPGSSVGVKYLFGALFGDFYGKISFGAMWNNIYISDSCIETMYKNPYSVLTRA